MQGMTFLVTQMLVCLIIAALIGVFIGWLLRGSKIAALNTRIDALEADNHRAQDDYEGLSSRYRDDIDEKDREITEYHSKLALLESKTAERDAELTRMNTDYTSRLAELEDELDRTNYIRDDLKVKDTTIERLESEVRRMNDVSAEIAKKANLSSEELDSIEGGSSSSHGKSGNWFDMLKNPISGHTLDSEVDDSDTPGWAAGLKSKLASGAAAAAAAAAARKQRSQDSEDDSSDSDANTSAEFVSGKDEVSRTSARDQAEKEVSADDAQQGADAGVRADEEVIDNVADQPIDKSSVTSSTDEARKTASTNEPTKVEPTEVEPTEVEPTKVEPTKVEPTKVEPTKVEPTKIEPAKIEPAKIEPTKIEPAKTESAQTGSKGSQSSSSDSSQTNERTSIVDSSTSSIEETQRSNTPSQNQVSSTDSQPEKAATAQSKPAKKELTEAERERVRQIRESRGVKIDTIIFEGVADTEDDLKEIYGIGPVMEGILNDLGIVNYEQLAKLDTRQLEILRDSIGSFHNRVDRDNWLDGARKCFVVKYGKELS